MQFPQRDEVVRAFQNLQMSMFDKDLSEGKVYKNGNTIIQYSGGYCLVFPFDINGVKKAVRCWIADIGSVSERYEKISNFLQENKSSFFIDLEYRDEAIEINKDDYPLAIMDWVEARNFKDYINDWIFIDIQKITDLRFEFVEMFQFLLDNKIAHGDLQHKNILVTDLGKIKLVDYDSLYLPTLDGFDDVINGIGAYQHPLRKVNKIATEKLDYFSVLVIYLSLVYFEKYPNEWNKYYLKNELFFNETDYSNYKDSELINNLLSDEDETIVSLTNFLVNQLQATSFDEIENPIELITSSSLVENEIIKEEDDSIIFKNDLFDLLLNSNEAKEVFYKKYNFDFEFLTKHKNQLDWALISNNTSILWNIDEIDRFRDYLDWTIFSANESIDFNSEILNDFGDYWDWDILLLNNNINLEEILSIYNDWDWDSLSANENINFSPILLSRFSDNWNWDELSYNDNININEFLLEKFIDKWNWDALSERIEINSNLNLLLKFKNKWNWSKLSQRIENYESLPVNSLNYFITKWDWNIILNGFYLENHTTINELEWAKISANTTIDFTSEILEEYEGFWDWDILSANENINLSSVIYKKFKKRWNYNNILRNKSFINNNKLHKLINWKAISQSKDIIFDVDFMYKFQDYWDWNVLSENKNFINNVDLLWNFCDDLNWDLLSDNENLEINVELLYKFRNLWNWKLLSANESLAIYDDDFEIINNYYFEISSFKWDYHILLKNKTFCEAIKNENVDFDFIFEKYINRSNKLTIDFINTFINEFDWDLLSDDKDLNFTIELLREFKDYWNWRIISSSNKIYFTKEILSEFQNELIWNELSSNKSLKFTPELINEFKDYWNWSLLSDTVSEDLKISCSDLFNFFLPFKNIDKEIVPLELIIEELDDDENSVEIDLMDEKITSSSEEISIINLENKEKDIKQNNNMFKSLYLDFVAGYKAEEEKNKNEEHNIYFKNLKNKFFKK